MPLPPCLPSFVSLDDLHSGLLLAAAATLSSFLFGLLLAATALSPFIVSLRDLYSGLAATAALSPFMISILGWLPLPSPFICPPSWSPLRATLGGRCRLVFLDLSPFMISILACAWLPLPPCLPSFVSLHGLLSGLLLAAAAAWSPFICFPSWSPF